MHYRLHASITTLRFFSIGRAVTEHREGGFSFAPTLFSGSLCRSLPTCMTYTCLPVQGCAGSAGWSTDSARSAGSAGKSVSRFQHYLHYVTLWVSTHYYQRVQDASNLCKKYCCPLKTFWYYSMLTDRTDCTDFFACATCFSTTEMTDFVSIACSLRYWPVTYPWRNMLGQIM